MANRDFNKIKRTIRDFCMNVEGGEGGTIKVDQLPEVGQEHTIYELNQTKIIKGTYNWGLEAYYDDDVDSFSGLVVETEADLNVEDQRNEGFTYVRTEDRLFRFHTVEDVEENPWEEIAHRKNEQDEDVFGVFEDSSGNLNVFVIFKEYLGMKETLESFIYSYKLLNDEIYEVVEWKNAEGVVKINNDKLVEVKAPTVWSFGNFAPTIVIENENQLPTYEQAVAQGLIDDFYMRTVFITMEGEMWRGEPNPEERIIEWGTEQVDIIPKPSMMYSMGLFIPKSDEEYVDKYYFYYFNDQWHNMDSVSISVYIDLAPVDSLTAELEDGTQLEVVEGDDNKIWFIYGVPINTTIKLKFSTIDVFESAKLNEVELDVTTTDTINYETQFSIFNDSFLQIHISHNK